MLIMIGGVVYSHDIKTALSVTHTTQECHPLMHATHDIRGKTFTLS